MILFCLSVLLSIPRVDSVAIDGLGLQPPPAAGGKQILVVNGRYSVSDGRQVAEIRLCARIQNAKQWIKVRAEVNPKGEWLAKIPLATGEYDCWVELITIDSSDDPRKWTRGALTDTKSEKVRVK